MTLPVLLCTEGADSFELNGCGLLPLRSEREGARSHPGVSYAPGVPVGISCLLPLFEETADYVSGANLPGRTVVLP